MKFKNIICQLLLILTVSSHAASNCHGANFSPTGSMVEMRSQHTTTLLPNGKVLIAGGQSRLGYVSSAELYDPFNGTFTPTGSMATDHFLGTATLLPNGKVLIAGGINYYGGRPISDAELYDPSSGTFTATGSMTTARAVHSATLLTNGKVLFAGGYMNLGDGYPRLASAELYDPSSGTFTATGGMTTARDVHTATLLPDGKVLIAGGENGVYLSSAELYDPSSGTFTATGSMATNRAGAAVLLPNGKVLIVGGYSYIDGGIYGKSYGCLSSAELYDPSSGTFTPTGSLATARYSNTATLLPNGKVLIAGGEIASAPYHISSVEMYDPSSGTFTAAGNMATVRGRHAATLLPNGKVIVTGGVGDTYPYYLSSTELYDSSSGTFTTTGSMATTRGSCTATLLPGGKVLIGGGYNFGGSIASAELYNPSSGTFSATGGMAMARNGHTATLLPNGKVLIAGGFNGDFSLSIAELYDPSNGTFAATGSLAAARGNHTATLLPNGKVLIAGGKSSSSSYLASAELYDPSSGTFTATGGMATARHLQAATQLPNGDVLIAGGYNIGGSLSSAELYDPPSGTFTATGGMTTARNGHTATQLPNGNVLIAGGFDSSSSYLSSAELYDPFSGTFMATGSMATTRSLHIAMLLPGGNVLIAGGYNWSYLSSAELYDPPSGNFTATGSMTTARYQHAVTLLSNGKLLVAGGLNAFFNPSNAELYDVGLDFSDSRRPVITQAVLDVTNKLSVTGSKFRGDSEASGEGRNSSTGYPLLQIRRLDNAQTLFISNIPGGNSWTDTSFGSQTLAGLSAGHYFATVFTNGIPSNSYIFSTPVIGVTPVSWNFDNVVAGASSTATFTITNNGSTSLMVKSANAGGNFSVGAGTCGTLPATLAPAASCTITATFSPISAGAAIANLVINSNDPQTPNYNIALNGTGVAYVLTITVNGSGIGTVNSTPSGIACVSGSLNSCIATFGNPSVSLYHLPDWKSLFAGWAEACTGTGDCSVFMNTDKAVTATFNANLQAILIPVGTLFASLQNAYGAALSGNTIKARVYTFHEHLLLNNPIVVILDGGKDSGYQNTLGMTMLHGSLTIRRGSLAIRNLVIK